MLAIVYVAGFVGSLLFTSAALRYVNFGDQVPLFQPLHAFCTLFVAVNIMICLWEISLYLHRDLIQHKFKQHKLKLKRGELPNPLFLLQSITFAQAASFEFWSEVWATYSLLDICYSEHGSFGFNIDVGNGFSTLLPNCLFLLAMNGVGMGMSNRAFGALSILFFYHGFYGTVVYFFQYNLNKRWEEHDTAKYFYPLVVGTNGFWFVGPWACMYACWRMIDDDSIQVFLS